MANKPSVKFINEAYKLANEGIDCEKHIEGYDLIFTSKDLKNIEIHDLKLAVYYDQKANSLIFAFAGTDPKSARDLQDDLLLTLGKMPLKFEAIKVAIEQVERLIWADNFQNAEIKCMGHSLGAINSDRTLAHIYTKYGVENIKSITFDSPGSYNVVKNIIGDSKIFAEIQNKALIFNADENFINTCGKQLNDNVSVVVPPNYEMSSPYKEFIKKLSVKCLGYAIDYIKPSAQNLIESYLPSFFGKLVQKYEKYFDSNYLASLIVGKSCNLYNQIMSHCMINFENLEDCMIISKDLLNSNTQGFKEEGGFVMVEKNNFDLTSIETSGEVRDLAHAA